MLAQCAIGQVRNALVVRRRLREPRDVCREVGGAGAGIDPVQPEPTHAGGHEVHHRADRGLGQRHGVDPRLTAHPVEVTGGVSADLVALADQHDAEGALVLVLLGQHASEVEVAGLEELQRQPSTGQQSRAEREERQRRHASL